MLAKCFEFAKVFAGSRDSCKLTDTSQKNILNSGLMLGQRRRGRANIKTDLVDRMVFAWSHKCHRDDITASHICEMYIPLTLSPRGPTLDVRI